MNSLPKAWLKDVRRRKRTETLDIGPMTAIRPILGELIPAFWQTLLISGNEKGALEYPPNAPLPP
jgi:hypothetical protein